MNHIGLFEGIGGFSLAARWMGWETIAWCEINPFCHKVLNYHFPNAFGHHDIKQTDFTIYRGKCDILTGGFPCQPYSQAGKRLGTEDDRHLWPEMLRAIREIQPTWIVGENVRGLTNWNGGMVFDQVQADLEAEGYEVTPFLLPACAVNAPHRRDRIWFIAHSNKFRHTPCGESQEFKGIGSGNNGKSEIGRKQTKWVDGFSGLQWLTSDPDNSGAGFDVRTYGNGQEENQRREGQSQSEFGQISPVTSDSESLRINRKKEYENRNRQSGERRGCDIDNIGSIRQANGNESTTNSTNAGIEGMRQERENEIHGSGDVTDTDGLRLRGESDGIRKSGFISQESQRNYWQNFPTQSPVCSRNDGISSRLVGITFSKHRQESIKAYGNAVVPQVVVQIFKAIEKYNNL